MCGDASRCVLIGPCTLWSHEAGVGAGHPQMFVEDLWVLGPCGKTEVHKSLLYRVTARLLA